MAADFNKPVVGDQYALVLQYLRENAAALAVMLNPSAAAASGATNVPTDSIRYNGTNSKFEKWNGSTWADLSLGYLKTDGTNAMSGLLTANAGVYVTAGALRIAPSNNFIRFDSDTNAHKWSFGVYGGTGSNKNDLIVYDQSRSISVLSFASANGYATFAGGATISGDASVLGASGISVNGGWFRSVGVSGWLNDSYGGGFYMSDTSYIRTYGSKGVFADVAGGTQYAGYFTADDARAFGKVLLVETQNGAGGDGPQIHFRHLGGSEWGYGIEDGDGFGLAMYYLGSASSWGTKRFRFGQDGNMTLYGTAPTIVFADSDNAQRAVHCNSNLIGFLASGGSWTAYSDNNGDWHIPGGRSIVTCGSLPNVSSGSWGGQFEIKNGGGTGSCKITFHRQANWAIEAGLDSDNVWRVGGGSDGANYRYQADSAGNLTARGTITGTVITQTSDEHLKTNIRGLRTDSRSIFGLSDAAAKFDWKSTEGKPDAGFIAQRVALVEPLAVHRRDDGYLTINVVPIVAHLAVHAADIERRLQRLEAAA